MFLLGRLIFKHNFTESEGGVVHRRKNLSRRLQHLLRPLVFVHTDFQSKSNFVLFSRVFSFALSVNYFFI